MAKGQVLRFMDVELSLYVPAKHWLNCARSPAIAKTMTRNKYTFVIDKSTENWFHHCTSAVVFEIKIIMQFFYSQRVLEVQFYANFYFEQEPESSEITAHNTTVHPISHLQDLLLNRIFLSTELKITTIHPNERSIKCYVCSVPWNATDYYERGGSHPRFLYIILYVWLHFGRK